MLERLSPALFVLIWSTGWIVAKFVAVAKADPLTFLILRYVAAGLLIAIFALLVRAEWPSRGRDWLHAAITGILLHALYLGGVWWPISVGLPAGLSAVIVALQPLLTALLAWPLVGERLSPRNAAGVAIGFAGVLMVLTPRLVGIDAGALKGMLVPIAVGLVSTLAVTLGTFYQKRFAAKGDLRTITVIQYLGALVVTLPVAWAIEPMHIPVTTTTVLVALWSILVLSIGAIFLMLMMIRRGAVSRVASLIYLVPPAAALQAWLFFGETMTTVQIAGMMIAAFGVYLATRK